MMTLPSSLQWFWFHLPRLNWLIRTDVGRISKSGADFLSVRFHRFAPKRESIVFSTFWAQRRMFGNMYPERQCIALIEMNERLKVTNSGIDERKRRNALRLVGWLAF